MDPRFDIDPTSKDTHSQYSDILGKACGAAERVRRGTDAIGRFIRGEYKAATGLHISTVLHLVSQNWEANAGTVSELQKFFDLANIFAHARLVFSPMAQRDSQNTILRRVARFPNNYSSEYNSQAPCKVLTVLQGNTALCFLSTVCLEAMLFRRSTASSSS